MSAINLTELVRWMKTMMMIMMMMVGYHSIGTVQPTIH